MDYSNKLNVSFRGLFVAIALIIILDFLLPGKVVSDEVVSVEKQRQEYYNAARNYHYSYELVTNKNRFAVSKDFAKSIKKNQSIEYSISKLFKEINWCKSVNKKNKHIYSLRYFTGLIFPLLTIISMILLYKYSKKIDALVMILKIILIMDLIYLIYVYIQ